MKIYGDTIQGGNARKGLNEAVHEWFNEYEDEVVDLTGSGQRRSVRVFRDDDEYRDAIRCQTIWYEGGDRMYSALDQLDEVLKLPPNVPRDSLVQFSMATRGPSSALALIRITSDGRKPFTMAFPATFNELLRLSMVFAEQTGGGVKPQPIFANRRIGRSNLHTVRIPEKGPVLESAEQAPRQEYNGLFGPRDVFGYRPEDITSFMDDPVRSKHWRSYKNATRSEKLEPLLRASGGDIGFIAAVAESRKKAAAPQDREKTLSIWVSCLTNKNWFIQRDQISGQVMNIYKLAPERLVQFYAINRLKCPSDVFVDYGVGIPPPMIRQSIADWKAGLCGDAYDK